ncbi:MAG: YebC/PmpR family DNA-binding transcriptional regulator, partial [Ignavibacteriales bacterium]|nr:YebC/PmpR family DNA-binding transcriptional regulator [Ignavibacteriales bacterium]
WATIERKKAVTDAKRGKAFTQIIKEITIAARMGGGDPEANPRLRLAIDKAKAANMPADNIKRAIQKGTGELPGVAYEDVTYEGYGPGGVALIIESVTDNKNRTVSEIRHLLERHNGKLGASNSVAWMFHRKGVLRIAKPNYNEDELMNLVIEAGADDMKTEDDMYEIYSIPSSFETVKQALESKNIKLEEAEIQMIPENTTKVEGKDAEQILKLMEVLEEHEDVQHVYANFDIDEKVLASLNT